MTVKMTSQRTDMLPSSFRRQIFTDETGTFGLGMAKSRGSSVAWQLVAVVDQQSW